MRRVVLSLVPILALMMAPMKPALLAQSGDIQVTLTCSDGVEISDTTLVVDLQTLTGLTSAVEAMTLYPAGLVCRLTEVPLLSASLAGGLIGPRLAFAQGGNPNKDYAVGGGRAVIVTRCSPEETNFGLSAHVDKGTTLTGIGGTVNFTIPTCTSSNTMNTYNGSHLGAKVDCLIVTGGIATLTAVAVQKTGLFANPAEFPFGLVRFGVTMVDSGLPGGVGDMIGWDAGPNDAQCGSGATPYATVDNGNINVHDAP